MIKLLSPDARAERRLAICLALIAGYVDAYAIVALGGIFVSFMSGNTTRTGSIIGQGNFVAALPSTLAIVFFVAGAFAGTWLTHSGLRHSRRFLLGAVAASLAVIIGVTQLGSLDAAVGIATLSLAMGMMNTTESRVGAEAVSLTFVTGDLHRMGSHLALAVKRAPLQDAQGPWDTHLRRARLLASLWAGFLTGAMVSGAATSYFGVWVLLPPFLILLALALVWVPLAPDNVPIEQPVRSSLAATKAHSHLSSDDESDDRDGRAKGGRKPTRTTGGRKMTQRTMLTQLLADPKSAAPAVITESPPVVLTYRAFAEQIERLAEQLRSAGLRPGDCVVMVLPNGLEFLVVFLAIAAAGLIAAPLNPAYKTDELRIFFEDIQPRAIIVGNSNAAVIEAAAGLNLAIWPSSVESSGSVGLKGVPQLSRCIPGNPGGDDFALLLHTSGTTSRPKGVPLTHTNVLRSALNIASHYALTSADRSLVVMPLFHGHGLIGATLATLASGGAAIVPPRFSGSQFWGLFRKHGATWYSAVPTIHEVLLERADRDDAPDRGARFIRSCSAALAPAVLANLEKRFGAPVLEAYGLTEAAHQVASNPLPPRPHKPATVGFGTGVEIAIIDEKGRHLTANSRGEVVVRGPDVMRGYRNDPEATAAAFINGWLRTEDAGVLDDDGYLALTGRIKELINRGGEKIAPSEIDDVLLEHPAVAEAAAFGVPDAKYGEEVWAAVVLKGDSDAERLQAFCRAHLADFKVPKVIRIVSVIPKNETGKIERRILTALFARQS